MNSKIKKLIDLLPNNAPVRSVIIAEPSLAEAFFHDAREKRYLIPYPIKTPNDLLPRLTPPITIALRQHFGVSPYLTARLFPLLVALPEQTPPTATAAITKLYDYRNYLRHHQLLDPQANFWLTTYHGLLLNEVIHPFTLKNNQRVVINRPQDTAIHRYKAANDYDQLHAVMEYIGSLVHQGISLDNIHIVGADENDTAILKRLATSYGWTVVDSSSVRLSSLPAYLAHKDALESNHFHETIDRLTVMSEPLPEWLSILKGIATLVTPEQNDEYRDLIPYFIEQATVKQPVYRNVLKLTSYHQWNPFDDQGIYLLLHASEEYYPPRVKSDDFLTEEEKVLLGLPTSVDMHRSSQSHFHRLLQDTLNLVLFESDVSQGKELHSLDYSSITRPLHSFNDVMHHSPYIYSPIMGAFKYAHASYLQRTYGTKVTNAEVREQLYRPYLSVYNPQFKGLTANTVNQLIGQKLNLSATSLQTLGSCRFRYMVERALNGLPEEYSYHLELGNTAHEALAQSINQHRFVAPTDLSTRFSTKREQTLAALFIKQLEAIYAVLTLRDANSSFRSNLIEHYVSYPHPLDERFFINGKIDRVQSYVQGDDHYVVVMDYKTGNNEFKDDKFIQGTDIQLVFYLNLLAHDPQYPKFKVLGFYYQPLAIGHLVRPLKSDTNPIDSVIRMSGITWDNAPLFSAYAGGQSFVKGAKLTKAGLFQKNSSGVRNEEQMASYQATMETHIANAIDVIRTGNFTINPLPTDSKNGISPSCEYCHLKNVCYLANSLHTPASEVDEESAEENNDE